VIVIILISLSLVSFASIIEQALVMWSILNSSWYLLPDDRVLRRDVFSLSCRHSTGHTRSVKWRWDIQDHIARIQLGREVGLHQDPVLDLGLSNLSNNGVNLEREIDVVRGAVSHELEFAVGGYKADGPVAIKLAQLDTLMELAVVDLDRVGRSPCSINNRKMNKEPQTDVRERVFVPVCNGCLELARSFPYLLLEGSLSKRILSFNPNLHSGVPERYARIMIWPATSARKTLPWTLSNKFTDSITSINASFFLYLTSLLLHEVAPVAWMVILAESSMIARSDFTDSVVMYILSVSASLF